MKAGSGNETSLRAVSRILQGVFPNENELSFIAKNEVVSMKQKIQL